MINYPSIKRFSAVVLALTLCSCSAGKIPAESSGFVFDTYSHFTVCGENSADTLNTVSESFDKMSGDFSVCYNMTASQLPENDIYTECLKQAFDLSDQYGSGVNITCGALTELWGISTPNPRIPSDEEIQNALDTMLNSIESNYADGTKLDFGAVSKGFACDEAYDFLSGTKTDYAVISLSSTTLMYGKKPRGELFRAGITNPETGNGYIGIIETPAAFISTSGGYERYFEADGTRYCHILDIETGRPVETDLTSVTVIVPAETDGGGIMSDFLSTLIFTEGTENLGKWLDYEEFEIIAADENGNIYTDCGGFIIDESSGFSYAE